MYNVTGWEMVASSADGDARYITANEDADYCATFETVEEARKAAREYVEGNPAHLLAGQFGQGIGLVVYYTADVEAFADDGFAEVVDSIANGSWLLVAFEKANATYRDYKDYKRDGYLSVWDVLERDGVPVNERGEIAKYERAAPMEYQIADMAVLDRDRQAATRHCDC